MSTSDPSATPPLTRRQLREIRNTGSTPVLSSDEIAESVAASAEPTGHAEEQSASHAGDSAKDETLGADSVEGDSVEADSVEVDTRGSDSAAAPDAEPVETAPRSPERAAQERVAAAEAAGAPVDLGVAPLTRRQAREHERIRTASVPIIAPDGDAGASRPAAPAAITRQPAPWADGEYAASTALSAETVEGAGDDAVGRRAVIDGVPGATRPDPEHPADDGTAPAKVDPRFGAGLLEGETPVITLPSFDQLIARSATTGGSSSTPNALILSQTPAAAPLVAPVTATGEVLVTGTFDLPEGLGSVGHAPGIHDGKETDAVLVDGELPAASSPTPVAASAAISTVRTSDEIIRPPAPEKGSRLVIVLGIVTGVLGLAAIGAFVLALTTGAL